MGCTRENNKNVDVHRIKVSKGKILDQEIMKVCNQEFEDSLSNKRKISEKGDNLQDAIISIASKRRKKLEKMDHASVHKTAKKK